MLLLLFVAAGLAADPVDPTPRSGRTFTVGVGFSHWYGNTFGAPIGLTTPGLVVGVQPGIRWLELSAQYAISVRPLPLANGELGTVGFGSIGAALVHELRDPGQRMGIGAGPRVGLVHTPEGVGIEFGSRLNAHYLAELSPRLAMGPAIELRALWYDQPGSDAPIFVVDGTRFEASHSDVQVDLHVAVAFW